jgi:hypothetical protein
MVQHWKPCVQQSMVHSSTASQHGDVALVACGHTRVLRMRHKAMSPHPPPGRRCCGAAMCPGPPPPAASPHTASCGKCHAVAHPTACALPPPGRWCCGAAVRPGPPPPAATPHHTSSPRTPRWRVVLWCCSAGMAMCAAQQGCRGCSPLHRPGKRKGGRGGGWGVCVWGGGAAVTVGLYVASSGATTAYAPAAWGAIIAQHGSRRCAPYDP